MEVNAEVKRGKERQRNSPADCFDISPKVHYIGYIVAL